MRVCTSESKFTHADDRLFRIPPTGARNSPLIDYYLLLAKVNSMTARRFREPFLIAHLITLGLSVPLVVLLTFTYMSAEKFQFRSIAMTAVLLDACLANLLGGLAIKRKGHSPWWGLTGFLMGLIPFILYLVLPDRGQKPGEA